MARGSEMLALMKERRSQLDTEINQLMVRRAEIDLMIARLTDGEVTTGSPSDPPARRRNVKRTVMELVNVAGSSGITATEVIERARSLGRELDRASVASLLSKFKGDGVLTFDGERYYPASRTPPQDPPSPLRVIG
jgi:hypothetical protein